MEKLQLKPERHYDRVHSWLRKNFGKACRCESNNCTKKSKSFHWALIHGFEYENKRENFKMLCQSCHKIYDTTDVVKNKMSLSKRGSNHSKAKLSEKEVLEIRKTHDGSSGASKKLSEIHKVSWSTIHYIIIRKTWKHI